MTPWIGVDLDGTLAEYHGWDGGKIGKPIPRMVELVTAAVEEGQELRIFTARVSPGNGLTEAEIAAETAKIEAWCQEHLGRVFPVTCMKDYGMVDLWDDRCTQFVPNTGLTLWEYEGW
jgi:hypothetical protein